MRIARGSGSFVAQAAHAIPKNGLTGKAVIAAGCGPKDWPERRALLGPRG